MKMLLKNALVLIGGNLEKKDLKISDGIIVEINDSIDNVNNIDDSVAEDSFDLSGMIIIPGFVNTHTHIGMSLLRGFAEDLNFDDWLFKNILPAEEKLTPDAIYFGSLVSMMEMAAHGVVAFCDMYFYEDAVAKAVKDFGLKALLTRGLVDNNGDDNGRLKENISLYEKWHGYDNRIFVGLGPHAPYTCSKEYLLKIVEVAKVNNMIVTMHFFENKWEYDKYSPEEILRLGFDEVHFIPVHCTQLNEDNVEILKGTYPSINTASNMKLGNGIPPVAEMLKKEICITIGTDGPASNNSQNILFDTRVSVLAQKIKNPKNFSVHNAFDSMTINGYKALKLNGGSIEVGAPADLVILEATHPQLQPIQNFLSNLIHSYTDSVYGTIVNGRFVYLDGTYPTIDAQEVLKAFTSFSRKVTGIES